jgi:D-alanyl-D-alanine carboxypeptidase/D-alanyl-D-alanine carboxypeptidase (penicillin-binding protein 5/6)
MRNFQRLLAAVLCLAIGALQVNAAQPAQNSTPALPTVSAHEAVLIDAATGQVIFAKDEHKKAPIASITKIMTTLLLLEAGKPETLVTITKTMLVEGSALGLKIGDKISRRDLAIGMILASGNDAATAAAIHIAGSVPQFAAQMNARAKAIGMKNTNFVTPSGLDADGHESTAYDMALLGREALKNADFREICGSTSMKVEFGNPPTVHTISNHNRLLKIYADCIGIKTGFTQKAGRTLVSAAERDGTTLVCVTLNDYDDWDDHVKLFNYGFSQVKPFALDESLPNVALTIVGGKQSTVALEFASVPQADGFGKHTSIRREILLRPFEYAPLPQNKSVGYARYFAADGTMLAEVPLITAIKVEQFGGAKDTIAESDKFT